MATIRVNKTKNYTVLSNHHLQNTKLSLKAKGLLSVMLSLPDDWNYTIKGLVSILKENETSVTTTLNELKEFHYLKITKLNPNETKSGRFEYIYDIYERPEDLDAAIDKEELSKNNEQKLLMENDVKLSNDQNNISREDTQNVYTRNEHDENQGVENVHTRNEHDENQGVENVHTRNEHDGNQGVENVYTRNEHDGNLGLENLALEKQGLEFLEVENLGLYKRTNLSITKNKEELNFSEIPSYFSRWIEKGAIARINIKELLSNNSYSENDLAGINNMLEIISDILASKKKVMNVGKQEYDGELLRSRFAKLSNKHIEYVLSNVNIQLKKQDIRNVDAYLTKALYTSLRNVKFSTKQKGDSEDDILDPEKLDDYIVVDGIQDLTLKSVFKHFEYEYMQNNLVFDNAKKKCVRKLYSIYSGRKLIIALNEAVCYGKLNLFYIGKILDEWTAKDLTIEQLEKGERGSESSLLP